MGDPLDAVPQPISDLYQFDRNEAPGRQDRRALSDARVGAEVEHRNALSCARLREIEVVPALHPEGGGHAFLEPGRLSLVEQMGGDLRVPDDKGRQVDLGVRVDPFRVELHVGVDHGASAGRDLLGHTAEGPAPAPEPRAVGVAQREDPGRRLLPLLVLPREGERGEHDASRIPAVAHPAERGVGVEARGLQVDDDHRAALDGELQLG
jgi:hypothetical protein